MDKFIEQLKKDPLVYYIYQTDLSIYGIPDEENYTIITDDNYIPNNPDLEHYAFYKMSTWWKIMNENSLLAWICSCIDKKHTIKQHVKLMIPLDILKLRKNILDQLKYSDYQSYPDLDDCLSEMIMDIVSLNLTNQIIENHKIVNLQSPSKEFKLLKNCKDYYSCLNKYKEIINKGLEVLHKNTDDLYKQELIKNKLNEK